MRESEDNLRERRGWAQIEYERKIAATFLPCDSLNGKTFHLLTFNITPLKLSSLQDLPPLIIMIWHCSSVEY